MTPAKQESLMQGQTGIAKKVYECVPISEPWRSFQVLTALRNMTGSTPDVRIVQGCLRDLVDSGLIRRTGTDHYQRIQVEKKSKPQEPKMGEPAKKIETQPEPKRSASPLEMLGELATEIVGMAEHMKRLAARIEDVALAVEQERESNAKSMESYRQLKALLKSLQGEGE
ncbi:hypothetical protein AO910_13320 [Pseudomonas aeruginosa]|nr:hypothetical protein AO910_13320 [Pseudomonas aeruginosa]MUI76089.1 hypothetical protein [Pseudomonas aeruginosa]HBO5513411.1 hypothetical protein [Pseudomonas aeruginosa]HBP5297036.1 hypothetical protein [Pseudomonas aeruginosa]